MEESNSEPKSLFLQRTRSAALEVGAECAMPPFLASLTLSLTLSSSLSRVSPSYYCIPPRRYL